MKPSLSRIEIESLIKMAVENEARNTSIQLLRLNDSVSSLKNDCLQKDEFRRILKANVYPLMIKYLKDSVSMNSVVSEAVLKLRPVLEEEANKQLNILANEPRFHKMEDLLRQSTQKQIQTILNEALSEFDRQKVAFDEQFKQHMTQLKEENNKHLGAVAAASKTLLSHEKSIQTLEKETLGLICGLGLSSVFLMFALFK